MNIKVEVHSNPEFKEVYEFILIDFKIVLVKYFQMEKPKGKRKWTYTNFYNTYNPRSSNLPEPILSDEIKQLAIDNVTAQLTVMAISEYNKR